jgi:ribonuclease VapC
MNSAVLDSSAVLAAFFREPGADVVRDRGASGILSAVSYSETLAKLGDRGVLPGEAEHFLASLQLAESPFDYGQARLAAAFRQPTRPFGLSFADRACLACASWHNVPVLTADRNWQGLAVGVTVVLIR